MEAVFGCDGDHVSGLLDNLGIADDGQQLDPRTNMQVQNRKRGVELDNGATYTQGPSWH